MAIKMLDGTHACVESSYANSLDFFAFDEESLSCAARPNAFNSRVR